MAGKTGTTSSNKDGWFLGFSSGVTTGIWMGRDDAKPVGGLSGGHAPARAFADYMRVAVAKRPVEQFDTELQLPEWQLDPDDEQLQGNPGDYSYYDENGNLVHPDGPAQGGPPVYEDGSVGPGPGPGVPMVPDYGPQGAPPPAANGDLLDRATGRTSDDPGLRPGQGTGYPPPRGVPSPRVTPSPRPTPLRPQATQP